MTTQDLPTRRFAAFLFDMDGTIISSIASAERAWTRWAQSHSLDVARFLPTIHGVRSVDTIRRLGLPGVDPEAEAAAITRAEIEDVGDIAEIPGARAFLQALPPERWAIVTSAPRELALRRLDAAGMPVPALLVAAEDIDRGKPAPDCFLLAAERLGVAAADCLVFEDAPAGIQAGAAAGATVVVVTATHHAPIETAHATIPDYRALTVDAGPDGLRIASAH
ncbi:sugar-phosphatase [Methylobacterium brachiatum]|jgi:mannitol-1-/sugar-/sorbitol-6-phosphatase|uniref:Sugar-phosphatase n=1 Tax=Methylobacterium brachiatum TaxID=269660 RepID=A0AAJ1TP23_9HYPH|nr:HAD-IA family hydrolase [Methylobacterium brachiatum]MCB4802079.1 HAD-IA family hydrolase [Methylobacterium brachiatum]MDQ0542419.1 sugar-phosphatase [Methylobacterium brachiatum]